jgi:hypothetical protein
MNGRIVTTAIVLAAAFAVTSLAAAGPTASRQHFTIVAKGDTDHFVLTANAGAVAPDSGTIGWCCWSQHFRTRDGQKVEIDDPLATFTGRHGTFDIRFRIEWLDAGRGYTVGTSTWKLVRGTGAYARLAGSGRGAQAWAPPDHPVTFRADGFLSGK